MRLTLLGKPDCHLCDDARDVVADVIARLKMVQERRKLIVGHRETPLSLIDIENMRTITLAGGIICPTNPGFYLGPRSVEDLVDFMVGKVLDLLGVEHGLRTRWEAAATSSKVE